MPSKSYLNFLMVLLFNHRVKHTWVLVISSLLIGILASFLFVSSSIKRDIFLSLEGESDFIVQKYRAGNIQDMPLSWMKKFEEIPHVSSVSPRVYGKHFYEPQESYFNIVGIDFTKKQEVQMIKNIVPSFNVESFLSKNNMLMGDGVKKLFDYYEYKGNYNFRPPDRSIKKVYFYDTFVKKSQMLTNDTIIMDIKLARIILGIKSSDITDVAINVQSNDFLEDVQIQLILSHFDIRILSKEELKKKYENLFNYKGGVFLALYLISLITFALILYQRYSNITHSDAKEIAILRISGWKISEVIWLKMSENFIIAFVSYMTGIIFAYLYVFVLDAPLLKEIFLGFKNLENSVSFSPNVTMESLVLLFFIFIIPFMLVILIPVWKIAISEPVEVMR